MNSSVANVLLFALAGVPLAAAHSQEPNIRFFRDNAPFVVDQKSAFERFDSLLKALPRDKREAAASRFLAFTMPGPLDPRFCQSPVDVAGVETVDGRTGGLVYICREAMSELIDAVGTAFLIMIADVPEEQKERAFDRWLSETGRGAIDKFRLVKRNSLVFYCNCGWQAYVYLRGLPGTACMEGMQPVEVRDYMWPRLKDRIKDAGVTGTFYSDDTKSYWTLVEAMIGNLSEVVFDLIMAHELGHLARADPWKDASGEAAEKMADEFSFSALRGKQVSDDITLKLVFVFTALRIGLTQEAAREGLSDGLQKRVSIRSNDLFCAIKKELGKNPTLRVNGRVAKAWLLENPKIPCA